MPPLIVDPALQASVIRQFNLRGELAPFRLTEEVVPIFDIGQLLTAINPTVVTTLAGATGVRVGTTLNQAVATLGVAYDDGDFVTSGAVVNPGAAQLLADQGGGESGPIVVEGTINSNAAISDFDIEWRNAANTATLATWTVFCGTGQPSVHFGPWHLSLLAAERVRIMNGSIIVGTVNATILSNRVERSNAG